MFEEIKFAFHTVDVSIWQAAGITFTIPIIWYLWYCAVECQVRVMPLEGILLTLNGFDLYIVKNGNNGNLTILRFNIIPMTFNIIYRLKHV